MTTLPYHFNIWRQRHPYGPTLHRQAQNCPHNERLFATPGYVCDQIQDGVYGATDGLSLPRAAADYRSMAISIASTKKNPLGKRVPESVWQRRRMAGKKVDALAAHWPL